MPRSEGAGVVRVSDSLLSRRVVRLAGAAAVGWPSSGGCRRCGAWCCPGGGRPAARSAARSGARSPCRRKERRTNSPNRKPQKCPGCAPAYAVVAVVTWNSPPCRGRSTAMASGSITRSAASRLAPPRRARQCSRRVSDRDQVCQVASSARLSASLIASTLMTAPSEGPVHREQVVGEDEERGGRQGAAAARERSPADPSPVRLPAVRSAHHACLRTPLPPVPPREDEIPVADELAKLDDMPAGASSRTPSSRPEGPAAGPREPAPDARPAGIGGLEPARDPRARTATHMAAELPHRADAGRCETSMCGIVSGGA